MMIKSNVDSAGQMRDDRIGWWNGGEVFTIYVYSGVIVELKVDIISINYKCLS